jgi:putative ABC transport system permease protein
MKLWRTEDLGASLQVLVRYPARSGLTLLGLAIGVGAYIAMASFGEGARRSVLAQFEALGSDLLVVKSDTGEREALGQPIQPLDDRDVVALRRETTTAAAVIAASNSNMDVSFAGQHHWGNVVGTMPAFTELHDWSFAAGGMFEEVDVTQRAKVCVLGETPVRRLFGTQDPLGQVVTVGGVLPCRVVGVLAGKGFSAGGDDRDDLVIVPLSVYDGYWRAPTGYSRIEIRPAEPRLLEAARLEVVDILTRTHRIEAGQGKDFKVTSPIEVLRVVDRTSSILSGLLRGIAAVSLLVGGIGIMNIQLVSIAERTREIGIRAAIGASPNQILAQFLWEGLALTVVGAAVGVGLGLIIAAVTAEIMRWPRVVSASGVAGAVAFALGVGMVFGFLPARQAARLDPIEALRHE